MIDITFEIGGRRVSPDQIGDALRKVALEAVVEGIQKALGSVRCQEHDQSPTVKVKGSTMDDLSFEVGGCCQSLIDAVQEKLR